MSPPSVSGRYALRQFTRINTGDFCARSKNSLDKVAELCEK